MIDIYRLPKIITITGVLTFVILKFYLRNLYIKDDLILFAMGIYPNFLAGLIIPMAFLSKYHLLTIDKIKNFDIKIKCIMLATLIILIFEEYRPTIGNSKIFDYWDMIFSAIGLLFFYVIYKKLETNKLKTNA